ncbi:hypothetical protein LCGC14_1247850 [marine sediment metagenome]|uniref:Uncharacterized protein n=1 Tax=marine sediment metagenome TaxID=412755 RepID=A0A0F9LQX1_9ZZZZ|nr:hypothetical protein [bacterium]
MKSNMRNIRLSLIFLLGVLLTNTYLIPFLKANSNFTNGVEAGTQVWEVKYYDELAWQNTVDSSLNPKHWLGGEATIVGAKSKLTIEAVSNNRFLLSVIFKKLIYSNETLSVFPIVRENGYGEDFINGDLIIHESHTNSYFIWDYRFNCWSFTTGEFVYQSSFEGEHSMIIKDPQDFKQILLDYNDYANSINNDTTLQSLNISFPLLTGDDLLWQFTLRRFPAAKPINNYLITLKGALNSTNAEVQGNTLIFQRRDEQNFNVEVTYNHLGIWEKFVIKNLENQKIYEITSFYPKNLVYSILAIIFLTLLGFIIFIFFKRRKRLKA